MRTKHWFRFLEGSGKCLEVEQQENDWADKISTIQIRISRRDQQILEIVQQADEWSEKEIKEAKKEGF